MPLKAKTADNYEEMCTWLRENKGKLCWLYSAIEYDCKLNVSCKLGVVHKLRKAKMTFLSLPAHHITLHITGRDP